jgi:hypothetical protein
MRSATPAREDDGIPLCRIAYLGSPDDWGFAIYKASTETYQESILPGGSLSGTLRGESMSRWPPWGSVSLCPP